MQIKHALNSLFDWLVSPYWLSASQTDGAAHYIKDGVARTLTAFHFIYAQHF